MFSRNERRRQDLLLDHWGLIALSTASLVAYLGLVRVYHVYGSLRGPFTSETIGWYLVAFTAFVGVVFWAENRSMSAYWIWGGAILFRLLLLFTGPSLSDDVYRYLWDGHISNQGISPYAYAIQAPELDHLEVPLRSLANNPWMASPYLPAAQWVFHGLVFLFPLEPIFFQALMVVFDLLSGVLITKLLALASLPRQRLLLYLWNPLVVVESAHGAHIDTWMVVLTLAAVWLTFRSPRPQEGMGFRWSQIAAPLLFSLATLTKILPVLLLPVLFLHWTWRQRIVYGVVTAGTLLPYGLQAGWGLTGPLDGTGVFGAVRIYSEQWNFNSGLFYWLENGLKRLAVGDPNTLAKWIVGACLMMVLLVTGAVERRSQGMRTSLRRMSIPWMAYLLLTPVAHPWYALILLAFLPFLTPGKMETQRLWMGVIPWLYLSGSFIFSYLTYIDPLDHRELAWVRHLEWLPTLGLLIIIPLSLWQFQQKTTPQSQS